MYSPCTFPRSYTVGTRFRGAQGQLTARLPAHRDLPLELRGQLEGHVHIDSDSTQGGDDHLTVTFTIEQGSIYLTLLRETMGRRLDDQNGRLD